MTFFSLIIISSIGCCCLSAAYDAGDIEQLLTDVAALKENQEAFKTRLSTLEEQLKIKDKQLETVHEQLSSCASGKVRTFIV